MTATAFDWRSGAPLLNPAPGERRKGCLLLAFRRRVRELRANGMTQKQVAAELKVTRRYVQIIERKQRGES